MPWPPKQQDAIAARLRREGKSPEQVSAFFHKHGSPSDSDDRKKRSKRAARRRRHRGRRHGSRRG